MQYLEYTREIMKPQLVLIIRFLFNIHFTLYGKFYVLQKDPALMPLFLRILADFEELGLVCRGSRKRLKKFTKSSLLHLWQSETETRELPESEKFLVVESNFRYVAYTGSPYHRALLSSTAHFNLPRRHVHPDSLRVP